MLHTRLSDIFDLLKYLTTRGAFAAVSGSVFRFRGAIRIRSATISMSQNLRPPSDSDPVISFLLREPTKYLSDSDLLVADATRALDWYKHMVREADELAVSLGTLCHMVLPFDASTDARDQSNISESSHLHVADDYLLHLRAEAIFVRKLLRVKLADEADMKQAREAITMIIDSLANTIPN